MNLPLIISVDDHVLEPADLWSTRLPAHLRDRGPQLVSMKGAFKGGPRGAWEPDDEGEWGDIWHFEGYRQAIPPGSAAPGHDQAALADRWEAMRYDDMRPGAYDQAARLVDLDLNHTEASLAFPTFPRF